MLRAALVTALGVGALMVGPVVLGGPGSGPLTGAARAETPRQVWRENHPYRYGWRYGVPGGRVIVGPVGGGPIVGGPVVVDPIIRVSPPVGRVWPYRRWYR
jgi:hypothetical protein